MCSYMWQDLATSVPSRTWSGMLTSASALRQGQVGCRRLGHPGLHTALSLFRSPWMPLLDEADSFRTCQLDESHGIVAPFILADDSIHQYSRAQIRRRNRAQQQILQKELREHPGSGKDEIEATISEDLADGQTVILDASLKYLSDDELRLLIPSDELDDDEIHIIDTTFDAPHALHDYQMQLMLLEQQQKKGLLTAIQKDRENQRRLRENLHVAVGELYSRLVTVNSSLDSERTQVTQIMPTKRQNTSPVPPTKKRTQSIQQQGLSCNAFGKVEAVNGADLNSNPDQGGLAEHLPPYFDLIYRISCSQIDLHNHPVLFFRDTPIIASLSHLNGKIPILDVESFMENETDNIAFVIIRTVKCCEASVLMARANLPLRWVETIYMKSKTSKTAMQQIATCYFQPTPDQAIVAYPSPPLRKPLPFERNQILPADLFLFHHHSLLENHIQQYPALASHINALLTYTENRYGREFKEAESIFERGLVSAEHILKLFKPNELVLSGIHGRPAAFVVHEWPRLGDDGWVTITCWSFQTDGSGFARKKSTLTIPPIKTDTMDIQTLTAYPLRFATPEIRKAIRIHGEKQWDFRKTTQVTYKGWNVKRDQYFPDCRFMIDHRVYRKMHEYAVAFRFDRPTITHPYDRMPAYLSTEQKPSEDSLLLLPPDIHGFYLNEKKWVHLSVDCIHPVSWNRKAYERLVLPSQTKDLVRALVTVRTSQRGVKQGVGVAGKRTDITGGKGNGLIMLLHGGPGTGKTLTAESVAEIAEMPLYRVTCGDIGTSAEAVEKYLNTVLHLGKIWNCVLLLDEADVFLEERSMSDLKRNSLVSVFLRILEYYDGILILTSNRVGMFDEAFKSRIQVALHYENLTRSSRKKIWENFIEMLEEDEEDVNFDEIKLHLGDLASKELNGRQIRNVLTTARQLAIFKNERLDWEHLTQALSVSSDFSAYLKRMQGHTDDQRARDIGLR